MNTMSASQIKADFGVNVGDMIGNVIMIRLSPDVRLTIIHSIANPDQFLVLKDVTVDNPNVALESMEPMDLKIFRVDEEGNDIAIQVEVIIDALSDPYGVGDDSHTEYQVDVVSAVDPEGNSVILTNEENDEVYEKAVGKYFRTWHESANNITTNDLSISAATVKDGHNRPTKDNDIQGVLKPDQGGYHTESAIESRLTDIQDPNIVDVSEIYESVSTVDDKDLMMVSLGAYNYSDKALDATYDFESYVDALEQLAQETYDQEQKEALFAWYRKSMPVLDDDIKYLSKLVGKDMKEAAITLTSGTTIFRIMESVSESEGGAVGVNGLNNQRKQVYAQYGVIDGNTLSPARASTPQLESGVWQIGDSYETGVYFTRKSISSDKLLKFEDSRYNQLLDEINGFWGLKENFKELGFTHKRGIILYGAPGVGKSSLLRLAAEATVAQDVPVFFCDDFSVAVKGIKAFREIEPNRNCMFIFEDIDEIVHNEHAFLEFMDGESQTDGTLLVCTTNYLDRLPPRVLRAGRLDTKVEVVNPPKEGRVAYFKYKVAGIDESTLDEYVRVTDDFSFAECREFLVNSRLYKHTPEKAAKMVRSMDRSSTIRESRNTWLATHTTTPESANINIVKKDKTMQNIKTEGTNACKEFSESKSVVYALASNRGTWVNIDDRDVGYFSKAEAGQLASDLGGIAQDVDGGQKKFRVVKEAKIKQFALNTGEEDIATWTRELKYRYPNAEIVPNNFNGKDAFVNGDHVGYTRRNNSGTWQLWVAAAYKTKAEDDKKTEATGDNYKVPVGVGPIGNFVVDKVLGDENGIKLISFAEGTSNEGSYAVMDDKDNLIAVGMEINLINVISTHSSFEDALLRFQNEVARESKERGIDIMFPTVGLQVDDPSTLSPEMTGLDESSNDVFINKIMPALIRAQAVSKAEDLVKHVNRDDDGNYWTSDWYDSDATVASFSNGRQINNEEGIPEYFGNNWYYEGEVIANTNTKEELESKDLHVGLVDTIGGNTSKVWRVPQNDLKQVRESSYTSPFERAGLRVHMDPDKNTATVLINSEHDMNKFVQVYDEFSSQGGFGALEVKVNDDPDELHLYSVTFPMAHPGPEVKPDDSAMKELPISEAFHQLRNKHVN